MRLSVSTTRAASAAPAASPTPIRAPRLPGAPIDPEELRARLRTASDAFFALYTAHHRPPRPPAG
jgi:hypothetical protein